MPLSVTSRHVRTGAIWACIGLSAGLALYDGLQGGAITRHIGTMSWLGVLLLGTEACFVGGALLMVLSAGQELADRPIKHWFGHLRYLRREAKTIAGRLLVSRQFAIGFWLNFIGAVGTSVILAFGVVYFVPTAGWIVLAIIGLDLLATLGWRIPLEAKRRQLTKEASMKVRPATVQDLKEYHTLQAERWADENRASMADLQTRLRVHPAGMLVAEEHGRVVGMVYAMRLADYDYDSPPTWYDITSNGSCLRHVPDGPIIFGVDLSTARDVGARAGTALLLGIAKLAIREQVKWCMLGGRLPGYHQYRHQMSAEEYLWSRNESGDPLDPQVAFYTSIPGLEAIKTLPGYFKDPQSLDYGVLLRWRNPLYGIPFPRLWSILFPVLFRLERAYALLRSQLHHLK